MGPITLNRKYIIMKYYEIFNAVCLSVCPAITVYAIYILRTSNTLYGVLIIVENAIVWCWIQAAHIVQFIRRSKMQSVFTHLLQLLAE